MKNLSLLFVLTVFATGVYAQGLDVFEKKTFTRKGKTLQYRISYPKDFNKSKKYPVLTFLHGSGERGSDNEAQLKHGGALFASDSVRNEFKAIVIFPQLPSDSTWNYFSNKKDDSSPSGRSIDLSFAPKPTNPALLVKLLLDSLVRKQVADPKRMYIGGLSLGGFGTFDMMERYPNFFAAAFPICGGGDTAMAGVYGKKLAIWIFHGDADQAVDVKNSRLNYAALQKVGADVHYTEYPGVGHNSWDNVFREKTLLPWVQSNKKK